MVKRERELYKLAEKEGLQSVNVVLTKGNHYRVEGTHKGKTVKVITPLSPSCHRAVLNLRGNIRRAIRSIENAKVRV